MTAIYGPRGLPLAMPSPLEIRGELGSALGASTGAAPIPGATGGTPAVQAPSFADRVGEALQQTNDLEVRAESATQGLVNGEHHDVHGTMIAMQEADVAFRLVTSVRNRVVEAYREVMRMGA